MTRQFFVFDSDANCVSPAPHATYEAALAEAIDVALHVWPDDFSEALRIGAEAPGDAQAEIVATVYVVPPVPRAQWHCREPQRTYRVLPGEKRCCKCNGVLGERFLPNEPERCADCADPE